jgi:hypothetical protein
MKARNGFVSNSSSSSYIVTIHTTFDDFAERLIAEYKWDYFCLSNIVAKIDSQIREAEKSRCALKNSFEEPKESISEERAMGLNQWYEKQIKNLNDYKEEVAKLNEDDYKSIILCVFKRHDIIVGYFDSGVELSYFTPMHNDFLDGMDELLNEIIMYFMFDTDYKVECEREED